MRGPSIKALLRSRLLMVLVIIVAILIGVRIALPFLVAQYANRTLNRIEGYEGHIEKVDLHLWRGAYEIRGVNIAKLEKTKTDEIRRIPVFSTQAIYLAVEWGELIHGALVGQIELDHPTVNILAGPAKKEEGASVDDFIERIKELMPLNINRLAAVKGEMHFRNYAAQPDVDVYLHEVDLVARNLTNRAKVSQTMIATMSGEGRAMRSGNFHIEMKFDPFAKRPTYDLTFELKNLSLPELNNYLRYYLGVVARDGKLSLYAESSARDGRFEGYVKPIVKDLDVLKVKPEEKSVGETIKAFFVKVLAAVLKNKSEEQLATKVEFSGRFENPDISVWQAVIEFLRNAFVEALQPGLEGSTSRGPVGTKRSLGKSADPRAAEEQRKTQKERNEIKEKP